MKLRDKEGEATFYVTDPESGETWEIDNREYLTRRQRGRVAARPDMAVYYAHFLAEEMRKEGYENVEVRARVMASVNGREPQLLIDPEVNLAAVRRRIWPPATWILPLTNPLPDRGDKTRVARGDADEPGESQEQEPEGRTP
jgi:hypothetical protein